ncbi:MAG TPA: HAMP domain-containing sensor histidine kinase [Gemmatimonadaceae bacterium]|nr:HAMP domain-containing sensor histidine kinase [Gemmatimonadaceae bacterium]
MSTTGTEPPDATRGVEMPAMDLVAQVAHDFRTPLTSILFLTDALRSGVTGELSDTQQEQLELIYSSALQLSTLANDLTEFAHHGRLSLLESEPVGFSVDDVMHSVQDIVRPVARAKGLELTFDVSVSTRRVGHPAAVGRVLLNLVTNALKFTVRGSVRVVARDIDAMTVHFSVVDTGPGLPPQLRASISESDTVRLREPAVTTSGLGLVICRRLVAAMGGQLRVRSATAEGAGSDVSFDLPLPKTTER